MIYLVYMINLICLIFLIWLIHWKRDLWDWPEISLKSVLNFVFKKFLCCPYISSFTNNQTLSSIPTAYQNMLQGRGKAVRLGKQHNAPTHLPSYCIFRLVELSCAQFDYMQCAEMKVSNQQEIRTWNHLLWNQDSNL